ncbi:dioxygenase [Synechococcus sp. CS-1324]|uniref:dioxygenase family protein n=1 Tax=Synechococcus sp. CS-1324 TaxID=2847980 RepID=UPI000DB2B7E7|nr:class III extradiol ring-cleavage dioxygenase [Synechococcus sp. CS-1324]MCT0230959.1 dioxygenase [Synechococcus sp. CS-1324]PZV04188.1 MAG: dioxygenase [Cyanobium sp.]
MATSPSVLFVAHGSPMFAIEPGAAGVALQSLATELDQPRAVLVISPHWETEVPTVSTASQLETIHDFGGFDPALYELQYPASGSPQAAQEIVQALQAKGLSVTTDPQRGLDHGAWVPLRYLFPAADVPVVPLSIQHHGGPEHAYRVGQALAPLTEQGWLIVASGNITHNLRDWQQATRSGGVDTSYAQRFSDWVDKQLSSGQVEALLHYREHQPDALRAHPRDEHLLPLFTALGAAGADAKPRAFHRGITDHVIAMDGYAFDRTA